MCFSPALPPLRTLCPAPHVQEASQSEEVRGRGNAQQTNDEADELEVVGRAQRLLR
jgi:hypothetical protein